MPPAQHHACTRNPTQLHGSRYLCVSLVFPVAMDILVPYRSALSCSSRARSDRPGCSGRTTTPTAILGLLHEISLLAEDMSS